MADTFPPRPRRSTSAAPRHGPDAHAYRTLTGAPRFTWPDGAPHRADHHPRAGLLGTRSAERRQPRTHASSRPRKLLSRLADLEPAEYGARRRHLPHPGNASIGFGLTPSVRTRRRGRDALPELIANCTKRPLTAGRFTTDLPMAAASSVRHSAGYSITSRSVGPDLEARELTPWRHSRKPRRPSTPRPERTTHRLV